jgi:DNA-binding NarL/FixJ family response regulator
MDAQRLRVMVVDDNPVVSECLATLLAEDPRVDVCDRVESGLLAFARVAADRPDAVLMDLEMPGIGGLAAIKRIKDLVGPPVIIVVTMHDGEKMRALAVDAGADAFVPKGRVGYDLMPALHSLFPDMQPRRAAIA